jgi:multimeric flavodoxin WrbA
VCHRLATGLAQFFTPSPKSKNQCCYESNHLIGHTQKRWLVEHRNVGRIPQLLPSETRSGMRTYLDMGEGDEWPAIFEKIKEASILIFATPIWWGNHSSEMQKVIERLDEINDKLAQGEESVLQNKTGGIIITGDSDGAQHIIGNISNFLNAVGVTVPPFCTLSVMSEEHKKGSEVMKEELLKKFNQNYAETAETMANGLVSYSQMLDTNQTTPS